METFRELDKNKGLAIALGYFDGIHLGHRKILQTLVQNARAKNLQTAVITFDKNPADYFSEKSTPNIQTFKDKEVLLESLGIDYLYELDFETLKDLGAKEYLEDVIIKYFEPKIIVAGYNHTFGKNREGNPQFLCDNEVRLGYEAIIVSEYTHSSGEKVSSSTIRSLIEKGELNLAKALLGKYFSFMNSVIKGAQMARKLGYPTANMIWPESIVKLPYGVYHGFCQIGSKLVPALISWGNKPTLSDGREELLEAHLYNFDENLYGKIVKIVFVKKVREIYKYDGLKELTEQIKKDYDNFIPFAKYPKY